MSVRTLLIVVLAGFCLFCGWLVAESGFFQAARPVPDTRAAAPSRPGLVLLQQTTDVQDDVAAPTPAETTPQLQPAQSGSFGAIGGPDVDVTLGSVDPESGFKVQLELDSKGAAIRRATLGEFKNRDRDNPGPLEFLSAYQPRPGREVLSLATRSLSLHNQGRLIPLGQLAWNALDVERGGSLQTASFEATIIDPQDRPLLRVTKTYRLAAETYLLECTLTIDNLSDSQQRVSYDLQGPVGLGREAFRQDMRKVVAGFRDPDGKIATVRLDAKTLLKPKTEKPAPLEARKAGERFLWIAAVNKYFAAILVPVPEANEPYADWVTRKTAMYYNPDGDKRADSGDETIGVDLATTVATLEPAGQTASSKTYDFQLYLGPKDKSLFDKNELYDRLGFMQVIDFMPCFCCPTQIINPLAFGILAIMKGMHAFIPNYGVVIIILVFLMRLVMHPITKKSQVSMSKMSKLAPRAEEIKKKYANNKQEMNKKLMELYREQGASPITGMLPMFVQMPIWIALWSAVYTSIDLRGAAFLPFWITDLSVPDALISWARTPVTVPLLGWKIVSLNVLPILMGVAFYFQQKLMPTQASAATNPQMAQQQKMMQIMMPLLFPLMLYTAPSGVNLYIMASTFAGVVEQHVIRKHIQEKEEQEAKGLVPTTSKAGGKVKKKKPKPFFKT
ncbi:MAG: YidC/Oxa1 family insertase periplasmic-domain containing protein [Sedimentisphaerales bacterium]|nr:YidC/Oxa1 family insertase periplasmic-domain containing protein [Sedimentisphaerales bacterium]